MLKKINVLWQASLIEWPGQTFQAPTNINIGQITDLPSKPIWSYGTSNPVEGKSPVQKGKIGQIAQPMYSKLNLVQTTARQKWQRNKTKDYVR